TCGCSPPRALTAPADRGHFTRLYLRTAAVPPGRAVPHSVFLPGSGRGGAFARDHETAEGSGRGNSPCGGTQAARARRSATVFLQVGSQGGLICLQCADSSPTRSSIFGIVTWATIRSAFRNTKSAGRISRSRN